MQKADF